MKTIIEPFKIKSVEPIRFSTPALSPTTAVRSMMPTAVPRNTGVKSCDCTAWRTETSAR